MVIDNVHEGIRCWWLHPEWLAFQIGTFPSPCTTNCHKKNLQRRVFFICRGGTGNNLYQMVSTNETFVDVTGLRRPSINDFQKTKKMNVKLENKPHSISSDMCTHVFPMIKINLIRTLLSTTPQNYL